MPVLKYNLIYCRHYANCGRPKLWEDDKIKAYARCSWLLINTDLFRQTARISNLRMKPGIRDLTTEEVSNTFKQTLNAGDNGSFWVVFPNVPAIKFSKLNRLFFNPGISYAKTIAICRPEWKGINVFYVLSLLLPLFFFAVYTFVCTVL